MIAYTGIETISNMAEEAKDEEVTIPGAINRVVIAVFAIYAALPAVALSALPVSQASDGSYQTLLGLTEEKGGYAGDPILGVVKQLDLGFLQQPAEIYVGLLARRSCSSRRTPGSSACRGWCTRWACTARSPTACASCTRSTARPGSGS
jgi:amino acid transporter